MRIDMKYISWCLVIIFCTFFTIRGAGQIKITPLTSLFHTDTIYFSKYFRISEKQYDSIQNSKNKNKTRILISKTEYYLVQEYHDNSYSLDYIDSFVEKNKTPLPGSGYEIIVYKESSETNLENIEKYKWRTIDRYSQNEDWILTYIWDGKKMVRQKIKEGLIDEPGDSILKKIKIEQSTDK